MVTAFVLLNVERDHINQVAENLAEIKGVAECYSVAGRYDLVAVVRVKDNESLADTVANEMLQIDGVLRSETLISFRAYSRHDLERMFSIGLED